MGWDIFLPPFFQCSGLVNCVGAAWRKEGKTRRSERW